MGPLIPVALSVLPALAEWLGGARAGAVAEKAADVVAAVTGTDDPAQAALALADPEKRADLQVKLAEVQALERQAYLADVASARAQTVSLAQGGSGIAWAAPVISVVITAGFFGCVTMLFVVERTWDERTANLLNVLFGALIPSFVQVCNYWLGSSAGSKKSGDAVREIASRAPLALQAPQPVAIATTGPVTTDSLNDASLAQARGQR